MPLLSNPFRWLAAALVWLALLAAILTQPAHAQDIPGYVHRHWSGADGAPSNIRAIAQTPDGYLWLGSANGLYRFDGIRFEQVQPERFDRFRSSRVTALAAAPNGDLWVGYDYGGLTVYRGGRLRSANPETPRGVVSSIVVGRDGTLWVAVQSGLGFQLRLLRNGKWSVMDAKSGLPPEPIQTLHIDRDGSLLIAMFPGLYRLAPGARKPVLISGIGEVNMAPTFTRDAAKRLWLYSSAGLLRVTAPALDPGLQFEALRGGAEGKWSLLVEDGSFWIVGGQKGMIRLPVDRLRKDAAEYLPSQLSVLLRDREGTIWGGGVDGLHRYVRSGLVPSGIPGVPSTQITTGGGADRGLYVGTEDGVFRILDGKASKISVNRHALDICSSGDGEIYVATGGSTDLRIIDGKRSYPRGPWMADQAAATHCAFDLAGTLRVVAYPDMIYRAAGPGWVLETGWPMTGQMAATGKDTFIVSMTMRHLVRFAPGKVTPIWQASSIPIGFTRLLKRIGDMVYVGGDNGLSRIRGDTVQTLDAGRYPVLRGITGIAPQGSKVWLISGAGIFRISARDLYRAFARPGAPIAVEQFGAHEGFSARDPAYVANDVAIDNQGTVWLATSQGLMKLLPARQPRNRLAPPVSIARIDAPRLRLDKGHYRLPAGSDRIGIEFAALSLVDPERNRYRYRLDGVDSDWVEGGTRRRADFVGLGPGDYVFRVIGSNADGVWSPKAATVRFTIEPYFWQTLWFRLLLVLLAVILLALFVRWRFHVATQITRARIEDRVAERERIARDLHDTLLQAIQGLVLRFQSALNLLPADSPARPLIEEALDRSDDVLLEGRERVQQLRQDAEPKDMVALLHDIAARTADIDPGAITVTGTPRPLCAPVADEAALIVGEALSNAARHAGASAIALAISFARDRVEISVTDNGIGIAPELLSNGRKGHFGLQGMNERARLIGASLTIEQPAGGGTLVRLVLPAKIAFR
ncbi:two-component regulator propeller domain-containing protein [Blastomonas sp. SL216]|uniref:two-component regulator propeller domain-containing protein n=1 Tax=Blastomonas sp. SL216 TaxID=2995169 RepID=UPI0023776EAB|nr:triple tyrosine motif-containing protein [Blastomonas sp. SL216]